MIHLFLQENREAIFESELSGIFQVKLIEKNNARVSGE